MNIFDSIYFAAAKLGSRLVRSITVAAIVDALSLKNRLIDVDARFSCSRWRWQKFAGAAIHQGNVPRKLHPDDRGHIPAGKSLSLDVRLCMCVCACHIRTLAQAQITKYGTFNSN